MCVCADYHIRIMYCRLSKLCEKLAFLPSMFEFSPSNVEFLNLSTLLEVTTPTEPQHLSPTSLQEAPAPLQAVPIQAKRNLFGPPEEGTPLAVANTITISDYSQKRHRK